MAETPVSLRKIAAEFGVSHETVRTYLKTIGVPIKTNQKKIMQTITFVCENCGEQKSYFGSVNSKLRTFCSRQCQAEKARAKTVWGTCGHLVSKTCRTKICKMCQWRAVNQKRCAANLAKGLQACGKPRKTPRVASSQETS
jgi:hypothetical protein